MDKINDGYQVQPDGTIVQVVALEDVQAQLENAKDFLTSAQASKVASDSEWDAKILDFQNKVDSLQITIDQAQRSSDGVL